MLPTKAKRTFISTRDRVFRLIDKAIQARQEQLKSGVFFWSTLKSNLRNLKIVIVLLFFPCLKVMNYGQIPLEIIYGVF